MIYKQFQDKQLSALGLGTMRLPVLPDGSIDEKQTAQMIETALAKGINYFDTAWKYHGGASEEVIGSLLSRYPRSSYYLATKFPGYDQSLFEQKEEIFQTQLKKCKVDYFDFYLCHNVCERNIDAYFDESIGMMPFLLEQKAAGRIHHLGFSAHGELPVLRRFLEAYREHIEFCQLQLNYVDWTWQNAKEKIALMEEYQLPVWVMEPLRGGQLAASNEAANQMLKEIRPEESTTEKAFRFLQGIDRVTMILSGMSNLKQLEENIHTFETNSPMSAAEMEQMADLGRRMIETVPCTGCRYCTEYCPQGLDIPKLLRLYNENSFSGSTFALSMLAPEKHPSACLGCRSCEEVCPQNIRISELFRELSEKNPQGS